LQHPDYHNEIQGILNRRKAFRAVESEYIVKGTVLNFIDHEERENEESILREVREYLEAKVRDVPIEISAVSGMVT